MSQFSVLLSKIPSQSHLLRLLFSVSISHIKCAQKVNPYSISLFYMFYLQQNDRQYQFILQSVRVVVRMRMNERIKQQSQWQADVGCCCCCYRRRSRSPEKKTIFSKKKKLVYIDRLQTYVFQRNSVSAAWFDSFWEGHELQIAMLFSRFKAIFFDVVCGVLLFTSDFNANLQTRFQAPSTDTSIKYWTWRWLLLNASFVVAIGCWLLFEWTTKFDLVIHGG